MSRSSHQTCQTSALASRIPAHPNRPPGFHSQEQWAPLPHSYILLGGRPWPGPGDRDKGPHLPRCSPSESLGVLLADRGHQVLHSNGTSSARPSSLLYARSLPRPPNHPHCGGSGKVTVPPEGLVSCPQETHVTQQTLSPDLLHAPKLTSLL